MVEAIEDAKTGSVLKEKREGRHAEEASALFFI
jgi:hypothetical protein